MNYESNIGLEVHAQLLTRSKIFCSCSTEFGNEPNSQVCPVCLGFPGTLPALNRKAVEFAVKMGLATQCQIASISTFARKNYFYPDLPKGYQISQYEEPLCRNGFLEIEFNDELKRIAIQRIHLEEDAGKSIHHEDWVNENESLIDLNRCGVPLIEIVTFPVIESPHEAFIYLTQLRQLLRYLGICDGNMEQGRLRCDANVSIRPRNSQKFGVKTELKNMNSFHGVEKALTFEIERQIRTMKNGGSIQHETLFWDERKNIAIPIRTKEHESDYRYFPEPDLVPLSIDQTLIAEIMQEIPELPVPRRNRFVSNYAIPKYDANVLTGERVIADFFESVAQQIPDAKLASNWILREILNVIKDEQDFVTIPVSGMALAELLNLILEGRITIKIAKAIFQEMLAQGKSATEILTEKKLVQISDVAELTAIVTKVIGDNSAQVRKYQSGQKKIFDYFMGQVMRETHGKANPLEVKKILQEKLSTF